MVSADLPLSTAQEIQRALAHRRQTIADHAFRNRDPEGHLQALREAAAAIDRAVQAAGGVLPAELRHYLHGCSYAKAEAWLCERLELPTGREPVS